MWPFPPRYKIEVNRDHFLAGHFQFYVWKGCSIVGSGYRFKTAVDAAVAANVVREDLRKAWRISHGKEKKT